jgi:hypothetical protein
MQPLSATLRLGQMRFWESSSRLLMGPARAVAARRRAGTAMVKCIFRKEINSALFRLRSIIRIRDVLDL